MSDLEKALRTVRKACKTLAPDQQRIARRNARRRVLGVLKALRNTIDREFPQIAKPKPPAPPKPPKAPKPGKPPKLKLPFRKPWNLDAARLFVEVVGAVYEVRELPRLFMAKKLNGLFGGWLFIDGAASDADNWKTVIEEMARRIFPLAPRIQDDGGVADVNGELAALWGRFWTEVVPHADLEVAARHQVFLEQQEKR
ncbi:MAG: hypothetical protein L0Z62_50490 [Gemmataceae bacterium]|nr:hypothetical protein [Gemmataceae bacterium]